MKKISEADELLLYMVYQHCGIDDKELDTMGLSANEDALEYLARKGLVKRKKGGRIYEKNNLVRL